jgi:hypothetical protein
MVILRDQDAGRSHNIRNDNSSFKRVEYLKYLGRILINQISIQEEMSRLRSGNACYQSVQNILSSSLLSKSTKIEVYRTIMLPVFLYGCENWSLTLRAECRLRVFENRALRTILGLKREEVNWECIKLHNEERSDLQSSPNIV